MLEITKKRGMADGVQDKIKPLTILEEVAKAKQEQQASEKRKRVP